MNEIFTGATTAQLVHHRQILVDALTYIERPGGWMRGTLYEVHPKAGIRVCAIGAVSFATKYGGFENFTERQKKTSTLSMFKAVQAGRYLYAERALVAVIPKPRNEDDRDPSNIMAYNDMRNMRKYRIVKMFKDAIALFDEALVEVRQAKTDTDLAMSGD